MNSVEVQVIRGFVVSARLLGAGDAESALQCLLPCQEAPEHRVPALVVGVLLTGAMSTQHGGVELTGGGPFTNLVIGAAAGLDAGRVRELLAGCA